MSGITFQRKFKKSIRGNMPFNVTAGLILLFTLLTTSLKAAEKKVEEDTLFYAADRAFSIDSKVEVRLQGGYDIANPYMNVFGPRLSALYLISPFISVGAEGTYYISQARQSATDLATTLKRHGYRLDTSAPDYSVVGLVRVTPISGLVNLFSSEILQAEISILGRGGTIHYDGVGLGPTFGTGLEVSGRLSSGFGFMVSVLWDIDLPADGVSQTRTGFWAGPTLRF
jgi:hypothetical protein